MHLLQWPDRRRAASSACALAIACLPSLSVAQHTAREAEADLAPSTNHLVPTLPNADTAAEATTRSRPRLRVGFDTIEGAPRYADRTTSESGVATVRFSLIRPRPDGTIGAIPGRLPVSGARLTSLYGYRVHPISGRGSSHAGVDLAVATGTPVVATEGGTVVRAGWAGGYGLLVTIDHGNRVESYYGHLSAISVRVGRYRPERGGDRKIRLDRPLHRPACSL